MAEPVLARPEYGTGNPRRTKGIARRGRENERAGRDWRRRVYRLAAFTIATIPARTASGSSKGSEEKAREKR